jgi:hypothetical protein
MTNLQKCKNLPRKAEPALLTGRVVIESSVSSKQNLSKKLRSLKSKTRHRVFRSNVPPTQKNRHSVSKH